MFRGQNYENAFLRLNFSEIDISGFLDEIPTEIFS